MPAGPKRHLLTLQQDRGTAAGADGSHVRDWVTLATVWGEGGPLTGQELFAARQVQGKVTHRFKVPYCRALDDLTGSVRVLFNGRTLHLLDALNLGERNWELQLDCAEAADASRFLQDESGEALLDESGDLLLEP